MSRRAGNVATRAALVSMSSSKMSCFGFCLRQRGRPTERIAEVCGPSTFLAPRPDTKCVCGSPVAPILPFALLASTWRKRYCNVDSPLQFAVCFPLNRFDAKFTCPHDQFGPLPQRKRPLQQRKLALCRWPFPARGPLDVQFGTVDLVFK